MARALFIFFMLLPSRLWAASPEPVDFFSSGVKLFVGMAVVIGIMLLIHVLNRKGFKFLESRQSRRIKIVETRPMGGRKSLCLVEIEGERLLLGVGNDRVNMLYHFNGTPDAGCFEDELQARVEAEK
ncbi:MAG: flagellar biosynthetic protein FliO [Desulfobacteraceae bacterium]|nr:flagellar biosynthetic protein FliO [Desulfobacteraceae bacterium]MCF8094260.1 flagellar biosynthetic protein FliO [Desulfobacteraceae bacterium]